MIAMTHAFHVALGWTIVVVVLAAFLHDVGMSIHRRDHEDWSLFLSEPKMRELLDGIYEEPELTVVVSEVLQTITSHRADGEPLRTSVEASVLPPLPPAVERAVYRIATEALTNVVRHSRASSAVVRLCCDGAGLRCDVLDDGGRTAPWTPGIGIAGMLERVAELGGTCEVGPGPQGGLVRVCVPVLA